jgi:hypothetical protein
MTHQTPIMVEVNEINGPLEFGNPVDTNGYMIDGFSFKRLGNSRAEVRVSFGEEPPIDGVEIVWRFSGS